MANQSGDGEPRRSGERSSACEAGRSPKSTRAFIGAIGVISAVAAGILLPPSSDFCRMLVAPLAQADCLELANAAGVMAAWLAVSGSQVDQLTLTLSRECQCPSLSASGRLLPSERLLDAVLAAAHRQYMLGNAIRPMRNFLVHAGCALLDAGEHRRASDLYGRVVTLRRGPGRLGFSGSAQPADVARHLDASGAFLPLEGEHGEQQARGREAPAIGRRDEQEVAAAEEEEEATPLEQGEVAHLYDQLYYMAHEAPETSRITSLASPARQALRYLDDALFKADEDASLHQHADASSYGQQPPVIGCLLHVPQLPPLSRVLSTTSRALHAEITAVGDGDDMPGDKWAVAEAQFAAEGVAVIDDVLNDAAQHAALRLVRESVGAWFGKGRAGLKANVEDGLHGGGLMLQLASELREAMPAALGAHAIRRAWAYKADDANDADVDGLGVHAEPYAVTALIFLTPDAANLAPADEPDAGGLVVYHARMPDESCSHSWSYRSHEERVDLLQLEAQHRAQHGAQHVASIDQVVHTDSEKSRRGLVAQAEATKERLLAQTLWANTTVAFRFNRLVLFRSCRLHETKRPAYFRPGFVNRRASAALLFGEGGPETCA